MLYDLTKPIHPDMDVWPGDKHFERTEKQFGDFVTSAVSMSLHSGTHMDAPSHLYRDGKTIDKLQPFILKTLVERDTDPKNKAVFFRDAITADKARSLVEQHVALVGTASNSIDKPDVTEVHAILLRAGIPIVENLLLDKVKPGEYISLIFPLKIVGADGSPVRILLADTIQDLEMG